MLNNKEKKKFEIIKGLVENNKTIKEAMNELMLSRQQIHRLVIIYKSKGESGFVHGNRGKPNPNKKPKEMINEIKELYIEKHFDYNFEHFYEDHILGKYDISYDVMLNEFKKDDIISPLAHKKTVKEYKDKMREFIKSNTTEDKEEKTELFKSRIIEAEKAHPRRASNLYVFGQEIQMDACKKNGLVIYHPIYT